MLLADAARAAGVPCVFVRLITQAGRRNRFPDGMEKPPRCQRPRRFAAQGSRGAEFVGPQPQGGEMVFSKKRYSGFSWHRPGCGAARAGR